MYYNYQRGFDRWVSEANESFSIVQPNIDYPDSLGPHETVRICVLSCKMCSQMYICARRERKELKGRRRACKKIREKHVRHLRDKRLVRRRLLSICGACGTAEFHSNRSVVITIRRPSRKSRRKMCPPLSEQRSLYCVVVGSKYF